MTDKKIVLTTAGTREEAGKIARALVERRLAACVNLVGPMQSVYRWKGAVETAEEWLLVVKTTAEAVHQVRAAIEDGSEEYLAWIGENVSGS
jgi:periplasmic divalent cation tolerance protein